MTHIYAKIADSENWRKCSTYICDRIKPAALMNRSKIIRRLKLVWWYSRTDWTMQACLQRHAQSFSRKDSKLGYGVHWFLCEFLKVLHFAVQLLDRKSRKVRSVEMQWFSIVVWELLPPVWQCSINNPRNVLIFVVVFRVQSAVFVALWTRSDSKQGLTLPSTRARLLLLLPFHWHNVLL